ncbi:hypothetical protein D9M70_440180 [compost metagenome]
MRRVANQGHAVTPWPLDVDRNCVDRPEYRFRDAAGDEADEMRRPARELLRDHGQTGVDVAEIDGPAPVLRLVQCDIPRNAAIGVAVSQDASAWCHRHQRARADRHDTCRVARIVDGKRHLDEAGARVSRLGIGEKRPNL